MESDTETIRVIVHRRAATLYVGLFEAMELPMSKEPPHTIIPGRLAVVSYPQGRVVVAHGEGWNNILIMEMQGAQYDGEELEGILEEAFHADVEDGYDVILHRPPPTYTPQDILAQEGEP